MLRVFLLLLVLASALLVAPPAEATSVIFLTDAEQAAFSDAVVLGTVTSQRVETHAAWNRPVTISSFAVEETLHGKAPASIDVQQLKGTVGDVTVALPGSANLKVGERVVLFLHLVDGRWYPTALEQSKYAVKEGRLGLLLSRPPLEADLYEKSADGALRRIEEPARKPIYRLDDLKEALTRVKQEAP
ncbi:MAG: hypothetical protein KDA24_14345 [Deltaproteobacteria bacterium]|nr:hypothetical protein [Deltaproteobacteria bacterium]